MISKKLSYRTDPLSDLANLIGSSVQTDCISVKDESEIFLLKFDLELIFVISNIVPYLCYDRLIWFLGSKQYC